MATVTIYLRYVLDTRKIKEFEHYGKLWIPLVEKFGGRHHGYFMPSEGANNIALALFTFDSLAAYEAYRARLRADVQGRANFEAAQRLRFIVREERRFTEVVAGTFERAAQPLPMQHSSPSTSRSPSQSPSQAPS